MGVIEIMQTYDSLRYWKTRFLYSGYTARQEREWKTLRDEMTEKIVKNLEVYNASSGGM